MILERGAGFCTVSIKGLELQETSCHTTEAARIDDQFGEAFEGKDGGCGACTFNSFPLHCLTPLDAFEVRTYSDARNVLTGVVDSPDSIGVTLCFFAKSLVWVLLHHINKLKQQEEEAKKLKEKEIAVMKDANFGESLKGYEGGNKRRDKVSAANNSSAASKETDHAVISPSGKPGQNISTPNKKQDTGIPFTFTQDSYSGSKDPSFSRKVSLSSSSVHSFTDSIWSDDFDVDKVKRKPGSGSQKHKVSTVVSITNNSPNRHPFHHSVFATLPPISLNKKSYGAFSERESGKGIDNLLNDMDFGLPAVDVNSQCVHPNVSFDSPPQTADSSGISKTSHSTKPIPKFVVANGNHIYKPVMNLAGSPDFKCQYSSHIRYDTIYYIIYIYRFRFLSHY